MPFTSHALTLHQFEGRPLEVTNIFEHVGWRSMLVSRAFIQLEWALMKLGYYSSWLQVKACAMVISCFRFGRRDFANTFALRKYVLLAFLASMRSFGTPGWRIFWILYYVCAKDERDFIVDYTMAWSIQPEYDLEVVIFVDNGRRFSVPCSHKADDRDLLTHMRTFYDLQRTKRGLFELISAKSIQRIDVVKLHNSNIAGKSLKDPLDLGQDGPYGRQSHYFEKPSEMGGNTIRSRLVSEGVLAPPGQQQHALNIIRSWDPQITSVVILFPIVLSLIVSIVWSVVASTMFKADVQTSTQTGFTIGSYVVTAGALLIALVGFLDSKVNAMDR
ncbi:unnamed protein product [Alternaria burnsii]|nr:unnamed protein product [Alternaria burnsii]